ncbi:tripartite tricarboxylate transporter substrate-binding protein [Ramlibacter sp. WS9]|uniref:tripartite tricarboxylate transporter substrate-binding protein n=1 Tax=Ramlibacter sp. WS9 TaxID=1882741 RepID=UPI001144E2F8|nr:tripartite tricarboxylate transporter substrate-binding protein [Ramlibacter sp. WS9]ROZ77657.1 tripartite tricarboxylate transporter substrate binding protein [Ramlibacter sp. WS9]
MVHPNTVAAPRGHRLAALLSLAALAFLANANAPAHAAYPDRPVTVVVAFPPGGIVDIIARRLAQRFSDRFKQNFIVDNKTGAAGSIGYAAAARAPADGYTLVLASGPTTMLASTEGPPPWNPMTAFSAIGMIGTIPQAVVTGNAMPARTLAEFVDYARARPGQVNYGSAGVGTTPFFTMELFKAQQKINLTHVPYRGQPEVMTDIMRGELGITSVTVPLALANVQAGKMKALAVTSGSRLPMLPAVPTVQELGMPELAISNWFALLAPAGLPADITATLAAALNEALAAPELKASLAEIGLLVESAPPAQTLGFVKADLARWTAMSKALATASPRAAGASN